MLYPALTVSAIRISVRAAAAGFPTGTPFDISARTAFDVAGGSASGITDGTAFDAAGRSTFDVIVGCSSFYITHRSASGVADRAAFSVTGGRFFTVTNVIALRGSADRNTLGAIAGNISFGMTANRRVLWAIVHRAMIRAMTAWRIVFDKYRAGTANKTATMFRWKETCGQQQGEESDEKLFHLLHQ